MAYDAVKQRHPGAPAAIGARIREKTTARVGRIVNPLPGQNGVRVSFEGRFPPVTCDPTAIEYLNGPPAPAPAWRGR